MGTVGSPGRRPARGRSAAILTLAFGDARPLRLLALGAHCDDIEIGAGGTLLEWGAAGMLARVDWMVCTSSPERAAEAQEAASAFLAGVPDVDVVVHEFRDGFLPHEGPAVKDAFEDLKRRVSPDIVLTHAREDRHQDHRLVSDLAWNTFRDHLVLEYEIPKYDGDLGQPNAFVPISPEHVVRKWELLRECYRSQAGRYWFTEETFRALLRLRGVEARSETGYAEAFTLRKATIAPTPASTDRREDGVLAGAEAALRWGAT